MGAPPKHTVGMVGLLALTALAVVIAAGGCGGSGGPDDGAAGLAQVGTYDAVTTPVADVAPTDPAGADAGAALDTTAAVPKLILALSATLDTSPGAVKVTAITKAELLNTAKTVVSTATISSGTARFALTGLAAGHYFIRVNGLATDLVPTKIDNPAVNTKQWVGQKLRSSVIGSLTSPKYRLETFPGSQGFPRVVKYSDGTTATPKGWAYVIMQPGAGKLEVRYLQTAALLTSHTHSGPHSFATWMLGPTNHGKSSLNCSGCHGSSTCHPASYASIRKSNGWCYKCHYGAPGPLAGMVKPTQ